MFPCDRIHPTGHYLINQCNLCPYLYQQEVESMYSILAAILHIGDIKLEADSSVAYAGEGTYVSNMEVLTYGI